MFIAGEVESDSSLIPFHLLKSYSTFIPNFSLVILFIDSSILSFTAFSSILAVYVYECNFNTLN